MAIDTHTTLAQRPKIEKRYAGGGHGRDQVGENVVGNVGLHRQLGNLWKRHHTAGTRINPVGIAIGRHHQGMPIRPQDVAATAVIQETVNGLRMHRMQVVDFQESFHQNLDVARHLIAAALHVADRVKIELLHVPPDRAKGFG